MIDSMEHVSKLTCFLIVPHTATSTIFARLRMRQTISDREEEEEGKLSAIERKKNEANSHREEEK